MKFSIYKRTQNNFWITFLEKKHYRNKTNIGIFRITCNKKKHHCKTKRELFRFSQILKCDFKYLTSVRVSIFDDTML